MSNVWVAKFVSMVIIFAGSLICGLIPAFRCFATFPRYRLSLVLSFGGGILIATSLIHILPEARAGWDIWGFTAEMSLCLGIFIVYFVEELAHFLVCHEVHSPVDHHDGEGHNHGVHVHHQEPPNRCDEPGAVVYLLSRLGSHGRGQHQSVDNEEAHDEPLSSSPQSRAGSGSLRINTEEKATTWRSLAGLVAFSIHAALEGLSVGLGRQASDVWYLCGAVAAHKLVMAFCLGMEVRNASSSQCTEVRTSSSAGFRARYVVFAAAMTPVGILIGTMISWFANHPSQTEIPLFVPVLQTIAGGALLYVAFFEVICRERARYSGKGLTQLFLVVLGFVTMAIVEIFIGHDHSPCEHSDYIRPNEMKTLVTGNSNLTSG